jgi:serine/threonine-protein kinase
MGAVYKVQHTRMGKVMALKVLRPDMSSQGSAVGRFQQEANMVAKLTSLNTISIFDFGEAEDGSLYLAMEYLPGHDLSHVLRNETALPEARVAEIGIQVCRSLAEAHENGIIHRDIKPANIMLLRTRETQDLVKVLDFGIAKLKQPKGHAGAITGIGDFVGTPEYLSPEQARGADLTPASDLYSLGAMLYELACGVPVFTGPTPLSVVSKHLTDAPVPPHERTPAVKISAAFEAVLLKALAKDPADRFHSADAMRAALEPLAGIRPAPSFEAAPSDTGDLYIASRRDWDSFEGKLRRGIWMRNGLALLIFLAAVAAGTYFVRKQLDAAPSPLTEEREPNDRAREANLIASGEAIRGHLGQRFSASESDKDFFRIRVSGLNKMLRVDVTGIPGMALVLDLFGPAAKTPMTRADYSGPGQGLSIPDWPVQDGDYFIELRAKVAPGQVPPENVSDGYTLTATVSPKLLGEETPPNYTPETASAASLLHPALGFAGEQGEMDYWLLDPLGQKADVEGVPVGAVVSSVPDTELHLVSGTQEVPAGTALWVTQAPGDPKRLVAVKVVKGLNMSDLYTLAYFTASPSGGRAVEGAAKHLRALGRRDAAEALVAGALKLVPDAPWADKARAELTKP